MGIYDIGIMGDERHMKSISEYLLVSDHNDITCQSKIVNAHSYMILLLYLIQHHYLQSYYCNGLIECPTTLLPFIIVQDAHF
jgi:hypothetical protein